MIIEVVNIQVKSYYSRFCYSQQYSDLMTRSEKPIFQVIYK
jgi:hypothetical protein